MIPLSLSILKKVPVAALKGLALRLNVRPGGAALLVAGWMKHTS